MPGAFRSALSRGDDVAFLINHEGLPLARRSAGSLSLSEDSHGLKIDATLDGTDPDVQRLVPKLRNKLLSGMSFGFVANRSGQKWDYSGEGLALRSKHFAEVRDVSVVNNPAYDHAPFARSKMLVKARVKAAQRRSPRPHCRPQAEFRGIKPE
jgi:HK97 family phage prohead protease